MEGDLLPVPCRWLGCPSQGSWILVLRLKTVDEHKPLDEQIEYVHLCPAHHEMFLKELEST